MIPRDTAFDSTLALLREGYDFIPNRCRRYGSDIFSARLMLRKVICMQGEEAARQFYDGERFTRKGAIPMTTVKLLQDFGSVQMLDGEAHRARKRLFLALTSPEMAERLTALAAEEWHKAFERWQQEPSVILHDEVRCVLTRAVCRWAGVQLGDHEAEERAREFGAMIDGAGKAGPMNWRGQWLRHRAEVWARGLIERTRNKELRPAPDSPLAVVATYRDPGGGELSLKDAGVELLNLLRPTVAVSRFITFAALALHEHPECAKLVTDPTGAERFVQEVRRFYPFFPFVGGRVRQEFEWRGHRFSEGEWVLFDLYGTNHDPRLWKDPQRFDPERFKAWNGGLFNFVPQGAGHGSQTHRCPGEGITVELTKQAARLLVTAISYEVPKQDLRIDLSRMPAIPRSGFVISNVQFLDDRPARNVTPPEVSL